MCMAAALDCMRQLELRDFWTHQKQNAGHFLANAHQLVLLHGLEQHCQVVGHPHWWCLKINDPAEQTLWQQECLRRGILTTGSHFITLCHGRKEVDDTLAVYDQALSILRAAIDTNAVAAMLECEINTTVFRRH